MWLRAETINEKLKQGEQTQVTDGKQAKPVLFGTQLEATSQQ